MKEDALNETATSAVALTSDQLYLKEFIIMLETLPEVWDSSSQDSLNKVKRANAFEKLLKIFKKIKPAATIKDVITKVNSLKSNYRKEYKKIADSRRSGAATISTNQSLVFQIIFIIVYFFVYSTSLRSTLITLPATENFPESSLTVTLIPAGHCMGSTMFLFTTTSQKILFTGDFRINCGDLQNYTSLQENGAPIKLNTLYVDTTFINFEYENFPKRSESIDLLIFNIKKWLNCDINNSVAIYTPAKYGYEFVFNEIYEQLGVKVYIDGYKWKLYSTIQNLVPGVTNNEEETRIHTCRYRFENTSHNDCIGINNQKFLYVYISAMKWKNILSDSSAVEFVTPLTLDVCFATHCSRNEIYYFVNYLSPDKIVGFPNEFVELGKKRTSELVFDRGVKKTTIDKKVDEQILQLMFG